MKTPFLEKRDRVFYSPVMPEGGEQFNQQEIWTESDFHFPQHLTK
jgi:hypothetical protein